ncbi:inositol monophosphatase family protein [Oscillatoria sp. CS-180]|uniref:3'(2'),5'-bisphosphate nucleotidase CysQ family protein n=1 Tax=Oscillatoria sp. CS-180 TaxID=3021720 RepID=UPI00232B4CDF|nr:inositol monophosphatase family protein [Oscillatoria sp. CS-180]MDB9525151.1 inositol monophosphatase family protein [Oscillatoria sp. CS-180]
MVSLVNGLFLGVEPTESLRHGTLSLFYENSIESILLMPPLSVDENTQILQTLLHSGHQARQAALETFDVFEKGHEDYVTTVDRALDRYLSQAFATQFPADGIITEENQSSAAQFLTAYRRLWVIDPIDGTEDFINRGQHYSVMVGLLENDQPQAGWVYAPAQDRLYWGGPEWGLFQRGSDGKTVSLHPCPQKLGDRSILLLGDRDQRRFGNAISDRIPKLTFNSIGSFGLKVLEVIKGQAGLYVYLNGRVKLWDTTGPLALAAAAGLTCCDLDGFPIRFSINNVYPHTLIHRQPMLIGWPEYVKALRPQIRQAVIDIRCQELALPKRS